MWLANSHHTLLQRMYVVNPWYVNHYLTQDVLKPTHHVHSQDTSTTGGCLLTNNSSTNDAHMLLVGGRPQTDALPILLQLLTWINRTTLSPFSPTPSSPSPSPPLPLLSPWLLRLVADPPRERLSFLRKKLETELLLLPLLLSIVAS